MADREKIKTVVFNAVEEFNLSREVNLRLEKRDDEVLFSRAGYTKPGKLDSISLVYFLVTLEEQLQKQFGGNYNLKTQDLIEGKEKDLKDIASLIKYIEKTL